MLAGRLESIEKLRDRDVKIITLTWNGSNELGHGCASGCEEGLTAFGKEAVRRMESAGDGYKRQRQACSGCGAACWKGGVCVENR